MKAMRILSLIIGAITIVGAISTEDAIFITAGLISAVYLGKAIKEFINDNSGGYES
jgi:hypothetical protein